MDVPYSSLFRTFIIMNSGIYKSLTLISFSLLASWILTLSHIYAHQLIKHICTSTNLRKNKNGIQWKTANIWHSLCTANTLKTNKKWNWAVLKWNFLRSIVGLLVCKWYCKFYKRDHIYQFNSHLCSQL